MNRDRITEIFEEATKVLFPRPGDYSCLSPENIEALFKAISHELAEINFRHEIGCTHTDDFAISELIENYFELQE